MENLKKQLIERGLSKDLLTLTDASIKKLKETNYNIVVDLEAPLNYLQFCCNVCCIYTFNYIKSKFVNLDDCNLLKKLTVKDFDKLFPLAVVDECFKMSYLTTAYTLCIGVDDTFDIYSQYLTGRVENTFHERGVLHVICEAIEECIANKKNNSEQRVTSEF